MQTILDAVRHERRMRVIVAALQADHARAEAVVARFADAVPAAYKLPGRLQTFSSEVR